MERKNLKLACGFEEDSLQKLKDSPTCAKESLRLMLTITASNRWTRNSIDVKSAFLKGKQIDRVVHLTPPSEFEEILCCLEIKHVHIWFIRFF